MKKEIEKHTAVISNCVDQILIKCGIELDQSHLCLADDSERSHIEANAQLIKIECNVVNDIAAFLPEVKDILVKEVTINSAEYRELTLLMGEIGVDNFSKYLTEHDAWDQTYARLRRHLTCQINQQELKEQRINKG